MESFRLQRPTQPYRPLSIRVIILSWVASLPSLALWVYVALGFLWAAAWGGLDTMTSIYLFCILLLIYTLLILLPMAIIANKTHVNPIKLVLVMWALPVTLMIIYLSGPR
jgi:hypothetical protein